MLYIEIKTEKSFVLKGKYYFIMEYQGIPYDTIKQYLSTVPNYPIVSVGCGNGEIEYAMQEKGITNFILVDPEPESFRNYPEDGSYLKVDYPTVPDLIKARPELIEKCVLFLCWPMWGESTYDAEAVSLLKPISIVLLYETKGASGGNMLHNWLREIGAPCSRYIKQSSDPLPLTDYRPMKHYSNRWYSSVDLKVTNLLWIARKGSYVKRKVLNEIEDVDLYPPNYNRDDEEEICTIC